MDKLILLDVDGVLNPMFSHKAWAKRAGTEGWGKYEAMGFTLHLNAAHGPMLLEAAGSADARLVWATSWENLANEFIAPRVGLPELPYLETGFYPKTTKVFRYLADKDVRAVWLDDERYVIYGCQDNPKVDGIWVHEKSGLMQYHLDKAVKLLLS